MFNSSERCFDWASAAPVSKRARSAFVNALSAYGNPSSPHACGMRAKQLLDEARQSIATSTAVKPANVLFTSGATEANNLAIRGHVQALLESGKKPADIHLLYLPTSHSSVVETMQALSKEGVQVEPIILIDGKVDWNAVKKQIRVETALVSMDVVCGETGSRWDTREMRRVIDAVTATRATQLPDASVVRTLLHVDASQAAFVESLAMNHLGADLMTLDAQKVGGVRGIGALIRTSPLIMISPIMYGGGQEQGLRPGTENPALACAFACALEEAQKGREAFVARSLRLRANLLTTLTAALPDLCVNAANDAEKAKEKTKEKNGAPHILNISLPHRDTDYTVMLLSKEGFSVSTKSACETDAVGSRVVLALTQDSERALSTLRISWGPTTPEKSFIILTNVLIKAIKFQDSTRI